jgi:hypothetical protein
MNNKILVKLKLPMLKDSIKRKIDIQEKMQMKKFNFCTQKLYKYYAEAG